MLRFSLTLVGGLLFFYTIGKSTDRLVLAADGQQPEVVATTTVVARSTNQRRHKPVGNKYRTQSQPAASVPVPLPDGPPLARVYQNLLHLRAQHSVLESSGDIRRANRLLHRIADIERRFRYPIPAAKSASPRVHAIGFYSNSQQPAKVLVTDTSSPIVLVLTAYSSAQWAIEVADQVQIDFVICTGYHRQTVVDLPDGIPVLSYCYDDRAGDYAYAYGSDRKEWNRLEAFVKTQTGGLNLSTATGSYYASKQNYVIGPESTDWRIQMLNNQTNSD